LKLNKMFSFRSILLAIAAFATIASAIPPAPHAAADADADADVNLPSEYRRFVDDDSDFLSKRAAVNADARAHFNGDRIRFKRGQASRSVKAKAHVNADLIVSRSPVEVNANAKAHLNEDIPIFRGIVTSRSVNADSDFLSKRASANLKAKAHLNSDILLRSPVDSDAENNDPHLHFVNTKGPRQLAHAKRHFNEDMLPIKRSQASR